MESYLMMLYVTLEQESALKSFFIDQGWSFLKPDLSVMTDKLGPSVNTSTKMPTPSATVTTVPLNTTVSSGKPEAKPSNSRKRISILNQIKQPVAKLPRNIIQPPRTSGSSDLPDQGQREPQVQSENAKYKPVFVDDVNRIIVKEEAVDSDYEPDNDDVDDNENTDTDMEESFKQTSADNDASGSRDVTEGDGEQDDETGAGAEEEPKESKMMLCRHCGKAYKSKSLMSVHERKHSGAAPYSCCGLMFYSLSHLKRHRGSVHGEGKTHKCAQCERSFSTAGDLSQHVRLSHTEAQLGCDTCGMKYHVQRDLEVHMASHRGEKKYKCSCGKEYTSRSGLSYHRRITKCL